MSRGKRTGLNTSSRKANGLYAAPAKLPAHIQGLSDDVDILVSKDPALVLALKDNPKRWNAALAQYRKEHGEGQIELDGLSELNSVWKKLDLVGIKFSNCDFPYSKWIKNSISCTDFAGCTFKHSKWDNNEFGIVNISASQMQNSRWRDNNLIKIDSTATHWDKSSWDNNTVARFIFAMDSFKETKWVQTTLTQGKFQGTWFDDASFAKGMIDDIHISMGSGKNFIVEENTVSDLVIRSGIWDGMSFNRNSVRDLKLEHTHMRGSNWESNKFMGEFIKDLGGFESSRWIKNTFMNPETKFIAVVGADVHFIDNKFSNLIIEHYTGRHLVWTGNSFESGKISWNEPIIANSKPDARFETLENNIGLKNLKGKRPRQSKMPWKD